MATLRGNCPAWAFLPYVYLFISLQSLLKTASANGNEMLLNGRAPLPGQIIKLPNLAQTFRELIANGKDGFYKGRIAQAIVELVQSKGGLMELTDLAEHKSTFVEPIQYTYANEVTVYEVRSRLGAANTFDHFSVSSQRSRSVICH